MWRGGEKKKHACLIASSSGVKGTCARHAREWFVKIWAHVYNMRVNGLSKSGLNPYKPFPLLRHQVYFIPINDLQRRRRRRIYFLLSNMMICIA
jgi:hypothetical protein